MHRKTLNQPVNKRQIAVYEWNSEYIKDAEKNNTKWSDFQRFSLQICILDLGQNSLLWRTYGQSR